MTKPSDIRELVNDCDISASSQPPHNFCDEPHCIDIWTVPIHTSPQVIEALSQTLSVDERQRAVRFHSEEHRHLFIANRGTLRAILSCYVSDPPESLVFEDCKKGKPRLKNPAGFHFNLAHSGGRAVYAVGRDDVGVDIELIKPLQDWQRISKRFFSPREADELLKLDPTQQIAGFFACWTRKEAYLKATGQGISEGLDSFYAGADPEVTTGTIDEDGRSRQWYFRDLDMGDKFAGSVVSPFANPHIRLFTFQRTEDCLHFIEEIRRGASPETST